MSVTPLSAKILSVLIFSSHFISSIVYFAHCLNCWLNNLNQFLVYKIFVYRFLLIFYSFQIIIFYNIYNYICKHIHLNTYLVILVIYYLSTDSEIFFVIANCFCPLIFPLNMILNSIYSPSLSLFKLPSSRDFNHN